MNFMQEVEGRYITIMVNSVSPFLCLSEMQILEKACFELYYKRISEKEASMIINYPNRQFLKLYHSVLKKLETAGRILENKTR